MLAGLLGVLGSLRSSLRDRGSDLVIRTGSLGPTFAELLRQLPKGTSVIAEEEVEYRCGTRSSWCHGVQTAENLVLCMAAPAG